jgi:TrmH family RNA methyltransferase
MEILSPSNPRILAAARLRDRGHRDASGTTLVDGGRELLRAIDAGVVVEAAFVCRPMVHLPDALAALGRLEAVGGPVVECSEAALSKVAYGERLEGIVAVVRQPSVDLAGLRLPAGPLVVVTEAVEKPGNLGAILRSADGAGADAVIASERGTDLFNPNVIRASLGTVFSVPVAVGDGAAVRAWLVERGIRLVAARVDAKRLYTDVDLRGGIALVVGSEAHGLSGAWAGSAVEAVRLPMLGAADSLNVGVAAAVLLYEARRQRGLPRARRRRSPRTASVGAG